LQCHVVDTPPILSLRHRAEPIRHRVLNPDQALARLVGLGLTAYAAEGERPGYRLERLDADGDLDHGRISRGLHALVI
jgi:hypothetical protein